MGFGVKVLENCRFRTRDGERPEEVLNVLEFCFSSREKLQADFWARALFLFHASIVFHVFLPCVTDVSTGREIRTFLSLYFPPLFG